MVECVVCIHVYVCSLAKLTGVRRLWVCALVSHYYVLVESTGIYSIDA